MLEFMNKKCELLSIRYTVFVKFNPSGAILVNGSEITVSLRSKPEKGKANRELIYKLADHFGVPKNRVRIISGLTSRKKIVEIQKNSQ